MEDEQLELIEMIAYSWSLQWQWWSGSSGVTVEAVEE